VLCTPLNCHRNRARGVAAASLRAAGSGGSPGFGEGHSQSVQSSSKPARAHTVRSLIARRDAQGPSARAPPRRCAVGAGAAAGGDRGGRSARRRACSSSQLISRPDLLARPTCAGRCSSDYTCCGCSGKAVATAALLAHLEQHAEDAERLTSQGGEQVVQVGRSLLPPPRWQGAPSAHPTHPPHAAGAAGQPARGRGHGGAGRAGIPVWRDQPPRQLGRARCGGLWRSRPARHGGKRRPAGRVVAGAG
jgi:hypothetical protein